MKTSNVVLGAILVLCLSAAAGAKTIKLGDVSDDVFPEAFAHTVKKNHSFTDFVTFKLPGASAINGFFEKFSISNFIVSLEQKTQNCWKKVGTSFTSDFSFADLTAGKYRFEIKGLTGPTQPGTWVGHLTVAAVPEADVVLMLLIGGGMVVLQLRRKQQSLERRPLAVA